MIPGTPFFSERALRLSGKADGEHRFIVIASFRLTSGQAREWAAGSRPSSLQMEELEGPLCLTCGATADEAESACAPWDC